MKYLRRNDRVRWWSNVRTVADLHESIVITHHHRQFFDLLAILFLLERHELKGFQMVTIENWYDWADTRLPANDPRREMFQ